MHHLLMVRETSPTAAEPEPDETVVMEEAIQPSRFIDNGDGTVTDTGSGLMWLKDAGCINASGWLSSVL